MRKKISKHVSKCTRELTSYEGQQKKFLKAENFFGSYRAQNTHNLKLYPYFLFHRVLYEFPMKNFNLICFWGLKRQKNLTSLQTYCEKNVKITLRKFSIFIFFFFTLVHLVIVTSLIQNFVCPGHDKETVNTNLSNCSDGEIKCHGSKMSLNF